MQAVDRFDGFSPLVVVEVLQYGILVYPDPRLPHQGTEMDQQFSFHCGRPGKPDEFIGQSQDFPDGLFGEVHLAGVDRVEGR